MTQFHGIYVFVCLCVCLQSDYALIKHISLTISKYLLTYKNTFFFMQNLKIYKNIYVCVYEYVKKYISILLHYRLMHSWLINFRTLFRFVSIKCQNVTFVAFRKILFYFKLSLSILLR